MSRAIATAVLVLASNLAGAAVIQDKTDRFTGVRSVSHSSLPAKGEYAVSLTAYYGKESRDPIYFLEVLTWGSEWRYLNCHPDVWLLDGKREYDLEAKYENSMSGGATIERFVYRPSRTTLDKLAAAKVAEYKLCNDEEVVSEADLDGIRKVLDATK